MDFTLTAYKTLLENLQQRYSNFFPLSKYIQTNNSLKTVVILRHDVDRLPNNALEMAVLEHSFGIKGSYYFRIVPESFNITIIKKITALGHEIGYHYEDIDLAVKSQKTNDKKHPSSFKKRTTPRQEKDPSYSENFRNKTRLKEEELIDLAYESFCKNLEKMREVAEIKTICMHGSPLSKYDNKIIWSQRDAFGRKYNYKDLGLIAEPYYDIDFKKFAYLTDTGRKWNGNKVSVRDKVNGKYNFNFRTTKDIINNIDKLPNKLMFTIHPERWTNNPYLWTKQLFMQNVKNVVKKVIIKTKE